MTGFVDLAVENAIKNGLSHRELTDMVVKVHIEKVLLACNGNQCRAARLLKVHRNTVSRLIDEHNINIRGMRRGIGIRRVVSRTEESRG